MNLCDKKTCIHNEWNYAFGTICFKTDITLKGGKCTDFVKSTAEQQKKKRERYGFSNLY